MNEDARANVGELAARGSIWATGSNLVGRLIAFITTMVMARLLSPSDFGVVAIGLICIGLLDAFRNLGVGEALIYRQRPGDTDSNTAFWIAVGVGMCLCLLALLVSPQAANFFGNPEAASVIAVLSAVFVIESLMVIHATRAQRDFQFAKRAMAEITKTIAKAAVSISLALMGFGLWSLVVGQIVGATAGAVCYWLVVKWRPKFEFDVEAARGLISYGGVLICLGAVAFGINRADQFSIGRHLDAALLGYYAVAFSMVDLLVANPARTVGQASFAAFSRLADDRPKLKQTYLDTVLFVSLLCAALGSGIYATAPNLVEVFLTSKWSPSITVMEVLALFAMAHAIAYSAGDVLKAIGRANILVWISLIWLVLSIPVLWQVAPHGIVAVAWTVLAFQATAAVAVMTICLKLLGIAWQELFFNIRPALVAAVFMVIMLKFVVAPVTAPLTPAIVLALQVVTGAATYILTVRWLRPDVPERITQFIKKRRNKNL